MKALFTNLVEKSDLNLFDPCKFGEPTFEIEKKLKIQNNLDTLLLWDANTEDSSNSDESGRHQS